ncbi:alpha/beta fold hydrolase [Nesterenkonia aerolata]|uniref:Alpha/beta hydrolase n=1 Tax=Nesterenkonia aerolata TaxID=3074079 RepID=A0ABU2DS62_9MICC|nr:alpha/beta hydrolase [Nesterenkonia sp. LY-0111]MDR8019347.1 alpha/beta hydrolase [Nesterenkonia sp. LY-0111]
MSTPALTLTTLQSPQDPARVVVLMPGMGTDVAGTWAVTARHMDPTSHIIAVDLPGHGLSPTWHEEEATLDDVARGVAEAVRPAVAEAGLTELPVYFAGISVGGAIALQLGLEHSDLFSRVAVVCSAAKIGDSEGWTDRAATVREQGTGAMVEGSMQRWFAPGFLEANPQVGETLAASLRAADDETYRSLCLAIGRFDMRPRLADIRIPVLAIAGQHDVVTTAEDARMIAERVSQCTAVVVADASHQAGVEQPEEVARLLDQLFG